MADPDLERRRSGVARAEAKQQRQSRRAGLPDWLDPELATLTRDRFSDSAWIFERKLDGERILSYVGNGEVRLMTRNQHVVSTTFPEITAALAAQHRQECVVDGEIVAFEGSETRFERLQQRLGVANPDTDLLAKFPVYYYLFDVLYADGRDTRPLPLSERKQILRAVLEFRDPLRYTEHRDTEGEAYFREACRLGWEGLVAKRVDAPYRAGRTRDWLKFKCESGQEFVIGGFTDPKGSRIGFGALLLGYYDPDGRLTYAGKVGTGFTDKMLRSLHASLVALERSSPPFQTAAGALPRSGVHWVEPRLVGEVGFSEWTRDGELRHPRFQGLRDDKDPADVVREVPTSGEVRS
jgi:bifunctional non-homologous end joining protein LigD